MKILIEKDIDKKVVIDKEKCIRVLLESGLVITDSEKIVFTETYN